MNLKNNSYFSFKEKSCLLSPKIYKKLGSKFYNSMSNFSNYQKNSKNSKNLTLLNINNFSISKNLHKIKRSTSVDFMTSKGEKTKNSTENIIFFPFNKKKIEDYTNSPLINHIILYNNRNKKLNKEIEEAKDKIESFGDNYKKIMTYDKQKNERNDMVRNIEKKYFGKGYKLSRSILKNNIFTTTPLLMKKEKNMIEYFKSKNMEENAHKKFPKNNSEKFLTNSYQVLMKIMKNNIIGDIEREEFLKRQKLREDIFYEKYQKKIIENEINANKQEIQITKNTIVMQNLINKLKKSNFIKIGGDPNFTIFDSSKKENDNTPSTTIFSFHKTINNNAKNNYKSEESNKFSFDNKHKRRKTLRSPTIIQKELIKFHKKVRSVTPKERRNKSVILSSFHTFKKEPINLEKTYNFFKNINENLKDFSKTSTNKEFIELQKQLLKSNSYNRKELKVDKVNVYKGFKNLKYKIEDNKILPKLKKYPKIKVSKFFNDKLKEEAELDDRIQNFEKLFLKIISRNSMEN